MRKRLDIAMGLIHQPKIIFLDEPTVGLDPQTRAHIWDYIRKLAKSMNVTIFLTTHYMEEADKLCDRVAQSGATVLLLGETGTGKELAARYIHDRSKRREEALQNPSRALKRRLANVKKNVQPRLVDKRLHSLFCCWICAAHQRHGIDPQYRLGGQARSVGQAEVESDRHEAVRLSGLCGRGRPPDFGEAKPYGCCRQRYQNAHQYDLLPSSHRLPVVVLLEAHDRAGQGMGVRLQHRLRDVDISIVHDYPRTDNDYFARYGTADFSE
jgi:hypothetical protein